MAAPGAPSSPGLAVLAPAGLYFLERPPVMVNARDLAAVLERAVQLELRQLWIGPRTLEVLGLPAEPPHAPHEWLGAAVRAGWEPPRAEGAERRPAALEPWLELVREERRLELVFPSWDRAGNPFAQAPESRQLLQALQLYHGLLRIRYRWGPGASGLALMRAVHQGRGGLAMPAGELPPPALEPSDSQARGSWLRGELAGGPWLQAYDVNGMYLAACSSAELGFGAAAHLARPALERRIRAGYYRANLKAPAGLALEPPFKAGDGRPHWYTAPALELLLELGFTGQPSEAWVYPEAHRWLEPWYARLRDARAELLAADGPAAAIALAAVKRTYTAALGRLAGHWMVPGDPSFRPDWRDVVVDRARANFHRHLVRAGRPPVAADADLAVWTSSSNNPAVEAAQLGLELSAQLGKWKPAGSALLGAVRPHMTGTPRKQLRTLLELLRASR